MSNWPIATGGGAPFAMSTQNADTRTIRLFAAGTANTPGAWAQLTDAAPRGVVGLHVQVMTDSGDGATTCLVDVAIGAAGSEVIVAASLPMRTRAFRQPSASLALPIAIPAGARVAARVQSSTASLDAVAITATPILGGALWPVPATRLVALGVDLANSRGAALVVGAYNGGAWVQVVGSTTRRLRALYLAMTSNENPGAYSAQTAFDVGVGAAGVEVPIINRVGWSNWEETQAPLIAGPFPVNIPAGTRLAVRGWSTPSAFCYLLGIE